MELSEVVNPHFAFPVVGVVLCAVLVFAFGFKSPVQPSSFESLEEDRKPKKVRHKKKPHSTEHLESHTTTEKISTSHKQPANSRATAGVSKPAATSKPADKSPHALKDSKNKGKKGSVQKPVTSNNEVVIQTGEDNEDGWETVSVSKKKKRGKKEQEAEAVGVSDTTSHALNVHNEPAVPTRPLSVSDSPSATKSHPAVQPLKAASLEPEVEIKPQRSKKERSSKTKAKEAAKIAVSDLSDKENTPEPDIQLKEEKVQPVTKSEKKVAKAKPASEAQLSEIQPTKSSGNTQSPGEKKSKSKKQSGKKDSASGMNTAQQTTTEVTTSPGSKASKSQKNKKDKQKKEVSPPPAQKGSVQEVTSVTDAKVKTRVTSSAQSTASSAQETSIGVAKAKSTSGTISEKKPDTATSITAEDNVTSDELGDWQEAKPSKKRKSKVRRDN